MVIKTVRFGFLFVMLTLLVVAGEMWRSSRDQNRHELVIIKEPHEVVVIEFEEQRQGNAKILISQHGSPRVGHGSSGCGGLGGADHGRWRVVEDGKELFRKCIDKLASVFKLSKDVVLGKAYELEELADEAAEKVDIGKLSEKLSNGVKSVGETARNVAGDELSAKISNGITSMGEKGKEVVGTAQNALSDALGDRIGGALKDSVDKMENWDIVDSPKRIGEDIEGNVSEKVEQGTNEIKEALENVKETSLKELFRRSKKSVHDFFLMFSLERIRVVISWWHLLGFSIAYGMGVWFTFISSCLLNKCLPKQKLELVMSKMHMVYFRAMAYCVGGALIGYMMSQGRKGIIVWNKMERFQGFNLVSALLMILINLIFLEPQANKLMVERKKIREKEGKIIREKEGGWNEKLKKLNAYSSTLNVSTLVVLTWHLAYIGQLLQTRDD